MVGVEGLVVGASGLVAVKIMWALALFAHELRKNCEIILHDEFLRIRLSVSALTEKMVMGR